MISRSVRVTGVGSSGSFDSLTPSDTVMKRCHELLLVEVGMGGCDFSELRKKNVKCFQRPNKRAIDVSHFSVSPPPLKNTSCYEVVLKILSVNLNLLKQKLSSTFQY